MAILGLWRVHNWQCATETYAAKTRMRHQWQWWLCVDYYVAAAFSQLKLALCTSRQACLIAAKALRPRSWRYWRMVEVWMLRVSISMAALLGS